MPCYGLRIHNFAIVGDLLVSTSVHVTPLSIYTSRKIPQGHSHFTRAHVHMSNTHVRHLLTGQVLHTLAPARLFVNTVPVPGQPRLLVTGDEPDGHVNLWDVDTGECAHGCTHWQLF